MSLDGHVVVITGGSSGIGRLAALEFARRGARVVVGARGERALASLGDEVAAAVIADPLAGSILTVPTDVSDEGQVEALRDAALATHGRIDTWINNAGVLLVASVADTSTAELRRVLDVNVVGVHNGVRAVLPVMRRQGHGTIVNLGSVESLSALPLHGAYSASKHGVRALTRALQRELDHEHSPVRVVLVEPSSIDTPIFDHARTKAEGSARPIPPIYEPDVVVATLVHVAEHPVDEVVVGGAGKGLTLLERLTPRLASALFARDPVVALQSTDEPTTASDNLFSAVDEPGSVRGRWGRGAFRSSVYTGTVGLHPRAGRLGATGIAAVVAVLALRWLRVSAER